MQNTACKVVSAIQARLWALADPAYKNFQGALIPTVSGDAMMGVRTPALRQLSKELRNTPEASLFLDALPHTYFDENQLHAFLLEHIKNWDDAITALDRFLPYVDNWATCDQMNPKVLGKNLPGLFSACQQWLKSDATYTVRYGIVTLMRYFLKDAFTPDVLALAAAAVTTGHRRNEYYVQMAVAWLFATAFATQYQAAIPYLAQASLPPAVQSMTVRKALDSYRVTQEHKDIIRGYL